MSSGAVGGTTLRPGIAGGAYPERDDPRPGRLDRIVSACAARLSGSPIALDELVAFARGVRKMAEPLREQSEKAIARHVGSLRESLGREPSSPALLARSFALTLEAARRAAGLELREVQIMGGCAMARGMLAEMATGEGKTITATLPAAASALAGVPVHVLSVNDYLVERDARAMAPVYDLLGLRVDFVTESMADPVARRAAYGADVCYVTAKQLGFDYLRDRLVRSGFRDALSERLAGAGDQLLLRGLCFAIVDEADSILIDEARTPLILAGRGSASEQEGLYRTALELARGLEPDLHFRVDRRSAAVELQDAGEERLAELAAGRPGIWSGPRRRAEWVTRALTALHVYQRDHQYLVRDGRVEIVDPSTGRVSPGRSWSEGLHQLIELKEGCALSSKTEPIARMSYQHFFRRYLKLAGMTGTAWEVASELRATYGLRTVRVPTHRPPRVELRSPRLHVGAESRWADVVARVAATRAEGRPVLVGTASVAASRVLSERLEAAGIPHAVLDARHDADEARIVARAGEPARVTVATRMAGRGTDIPLAPGVAERGGLHVIATERAEARRIDRQLRGRCGRQGDPGSFEEILSLDEGPISRWLPASWLPGFCRLVEGRLPNTSAHNIARALTHLAQRAEERRAAQERRALLLQEEALEELLVFSGTAR